MKTKKELKNAYKQQKPQMGVFQVKNTANEKVLIEASTNIPAKWSRHQTELKFGTHRNKALQADWNNFGPESFSFEILGEVTFEEKESLDYTEEVVALKEMLEEELGLGEDQVY